MMFWGDGYSMGYGWGGWIFMVLLCLLLIVAAVYLVRILLGNSSQGPGRSESAEEILKKRFARGEISKEELVSSLEVLGKHSEGR